MPLASTFRFLLPLLLLLSCKESDLPVIQNPTVDPPASPTAKTYLALGDSYTIGENVAAEDRFPVLLSQQLTERGFEIAPPRIVAQTGWRTDNLQEAIASRDLAAPYDLVSLLIGVNNQFQDKPIEEYETDFLALVETAIELAGGEKEKIIILSIPDYAFTPF